MKTMTRILALAAALFTFVPAQAAEEKIPIESLFKLPQYGAMTISPDGENIAALAPVKGRQNVVVINLEKRNAIPVTGFTNRDIVAVRWLNNKRLLLSTGSLATRVAEARGGGLYAVDRDGAAMRLLGEGGADEQMVGGAKMVARPIGYVGKPGGDSDDFYAQEIVLDAQGRAEPGGLYRIDSRTGRRATIGLGKPDQGAGEAWLIDRSGVPRVFLAQSKSMARIYYRKDADASWVKLDEFNTLSGNAWQPLALSEDGKSLIVASWRGRDKAALVRYDPETRTFGEVVAAHPQVDLTEPVTNGDGTMIGVSYDADKGGVAWFDETFATVQTAMDKALPGNVNVVSGSRDRQRFIVRSYSDVRPGSFYLFDRKTGKLEWLADSRPWIDPKAMSPMQPVRYPARDGLEIPAYLTVPKGSSGKNLPMVVMVHGGPWVTGDEWRWNPEVQFLASRGYAVLQPNYRGTTRYGWKHFSSSFKQWGLAMQDDVTDGVQWAIAQGVADPKRVCIYGGSYGGYATMMGLAKTPDLFKCGINYVGVTDLDLFTTATWSDFAYSDSLTYSMKEMLGDLDRERLRITSPVEMAGNIKVPVMMAYGAADVRVVPEHGSRMKSALERAGRGPEVYMMVEGEGHGFQEMTNKVLFYGGMEKFLDKHIGH
jgi:dipeptidyl aminopeptidase/acylaminoacyl peptidase